MKDKITFTFATLASILIACVTYWIVSYGLYYLWYENLVQDTIRAMIKSKCLE